MSGLQHNLRVQLVTQENFQWVGGFTKALKDCNLTVCDRINLKLPTDTYLLMWANEEAAEFINSYRGNGRIILWVRRYEYYMPWFSKINFSKVSEVVFVNDYLAYGFYKRTGIKPHVIYNAVEPDKWTYKKREPGNKIAMVGWINQKKNFPLALQILKRLPAHELHIAGGVQDATTMDYIFNLSTDMGIKKERINFHGRIPHEKMDEWLDDKNFILSCAISEGCPNNVLEAMAKGIKPVVHNWPGAVEQFPSELIFNTVDCAVGIIDENDYSSKEYADLIQAKFSPKNYEKIKELVFKW